MGNIGLLTILIVFGVFIIGCEQGSDQLESIKGTYVKYTRGRLSLDGMVPVYDDVEILIFDGSTKAIYKSGHLDIKDNTQMIFYTDDDSYIFTYDGNILKFKNSSKEYYFSSDKNLLYNDNSSWDRRISQKENMQAKDITYSDLKGNYIGYRDVATNVKIIFDGTKKYTYFTIDKVNGYVGQSITREFRFPNDADHGESIEMYDLGSGSFHPCYLNSDNSTFYFFTYALIREN